MTTISSQVVLVEVVLEEVDLVADSVSKLLNNKRSSRQQRRSLCSLQDKMIHSEEWVDLVADSVGAWI